jgi:UDP-N-acetylmuramoyl-tripeptide--D-alanyl-D-alanine ligase
MALAVGVDLAHVARALTAATPASRWRMELHERADGLVVVNDAYNANPASMAAALDALVAIGGRRRARTVAVLGEMLELGEATVDDHEGVGRYAAERGVDVVVTVGDVAAGIGRGAAGVLGWTGVTIHTAGRDGALTWVRENAAAGDVLLVKASRGAALETVAEGLLHAVDEEEGSR